MWQLILFLQQSILKFAQFIVTQKKLFNTSYLTGFYINCDIKFT